MTYMSLLIIGSSLERLDETLDPFLKNPKNKQYAVFHSMDEEIQEGWQFGMVPAYDGPAGALVSVKERYNNDFDAYVAGQFAYAEKNEDGIYGQYENPNGKYSYYVIGGRNNGLFQLCQGGIGTLTPRNSRFDPIPDPNTADITTLQYWDQELQAKLVYDRAVERHRYFYSQLGDIRLPVSKEDWPHFFKADSPLHGYDLEDIYAQSEDEYASMAASRANVSFAVLKDGIIYERQYDGRAGTPADLEEFQTWARTFAGLFDGLAPDTPLIALTAYE